MNNKTIPTAILLSNKLNRPKHYRLAKIGDIEDIIRTAGENFVIYLNQIGASIYIRKNLSEYNKDEVNSQPFYPHKKYEVGIIFGNHLIYLYLYETIYKIFPMSLEISFIFKSDYDKDVNIVYTKTKKLKYLKDQNNLDTTNIRFLITLKELIEKINKKTKVMIFYSTRQRGKVYKKALRHLKNVYIKPTGRSAK